jgi:hypothetical protein
LSPNTYGAIEDYIYNLDIGETFNLTSQLHFVTDDNKIIIGNSLANKNFLTRFDFNSSTTGNPYLQTALFLLDYEISNLDCNQIDLDGATEVDYSTEVEVQYRYFGGKWVLELKALKDMTLPAHKAWAICTQNILDKGELFIAENSELPTTITTGEIIDTKYFNFKNKKGE